MEGSNILKDTNMEERVVYKGLGVFGLLGVIFVVLKLVGVIDWSWWWVTLPFYGPIILFIIFLSITGLMVCLNIR